MSLIETGALTVAQYAARLGRAVRDVGGAIIEGEVQRPNSRDNGMLFFDLTDGEATLSCKVFSRQARGLTHRPTEGDLVQVVVERPDFWPVRGALSLIVADIKLAGVGELLRRREELRRRLAHEGLSDPGRRKPLQRFPRAVGVIAGKDSHAMADVVRALQDRFAPVHVVTCGSLVQGKSAPRDLIDAIAHMELHPLVDVIVIARGGGSVQDLVAFDDEALCRAIFGAGKPIVTAIGHTENTPVCNDVAHAAYTPSRSAELAVPSMVDLHQELRRRRERLADVHARLARDGDRIAAVRSRLDVAGAIERGDSRVRAHAREIQLAEHAFFSARERELIEARRVVDRLRHRLPALPEITALAANLDARAAAYFAARERELADACGELDLVGAHVDALTAHVTEQGRRVTVATRRQVVDHDRDYTHALQRLLREVGAGVRRRLTSAERDLRHTDDLIEARDFRRRGWILATDEDGAAVPSISGIDPGARLHLTFRDGRAEAVIETTEEDTA